MSLWVLTRVAPVGEPQDVTNAIEAVVEAEVSECRRCKGAYEATGAVPMVCPVCGARRDVDWAQAVEARAAALAKNGKAV